MSAYLSNEEYRWVYNRVVRVCVDLLIPDINGILLAKRDIPPYRNMWHLPGGKINFKETIVQAASRIAKREFGGEVYLIKPIGPPCEIINDDISLGDPRHSISVVMLAKLVSGQPEKSKENSDVGYFKTLPDPMHPYHGPFLMEHWLKK